MEKVYIFGHRNPDTDSVTAAITLSYLKNELGMNTTAAVLSAINNESKYVLEYFNVPEPIFLNDVKIKIKDLNYKKNYTINKEASIQQAYDKMEKVGISKIPVVDNSKKLLGIVSMKDIARSEFAGNYNKIDTYYDSVIEVLEGIIVNKCDDVIKGNLKVAAYRSTTIIRENKFGPNDIVIVGDRESVIEYAISSKVKLLVLTGNHQIKHEHLKLAKKNKVNIIKTKYDTLVTSKKFNFCNNVITIVNDDKVLCIDENESLSDFITIANNTRFSYYPVMDSKDKCLGILRYSDVGHNNRKKVILVDHNSYEQSAIGLDEAEILEIIDHHNIGTVGTNMPINFRNMPLGSTNTIIYLLYIENKVKITRELAGLMLSGILSDTLILTSPTTTDIDRQAVKILSEIAQVDYQEYGLNMLKAGSSIKGKTKQQALYTDFKTYPIDNEKIGLGQISTLNIDEIFNEKQEYIQLLNEVSNYNEYKFVVLFVTDIIKNGSYCLYSDKAEDIIKRAFNLKKIEQGVFLKGVVSRKKQILPKILMEMGVQ